ncbi:HEPN domain-containing protein [Prosthecomicrobium sp. N25]|uniref:HEPN domain-containing protein n=1 Tax=Prosthecomicrobium sp. N25 TaxID=3129254 RepID=UPI0030777324
MMIRVLLDKAGQSLRSAEHLMEAALLEGAANRAYFAMFHAARASLLSLDPAGAGRVRKHRSVIAGFGLLVVRPGLVGVHLGRWLNAAEELRTEADYDPRPLDDAERVQDAIERARHFLGEVAVLLEHRTTQDAP